MTLDNAIYVAEQKDMPETRKDTFDDRGAIESMFSGQCTWDQFQAALDAYRDAAYWAGYRDAKSEILESYIKGDL